MPFYRAPDGSLTNAASPFGYNALRGSQEISSDQYLQGLMFMQQAGLRSSLGALGSRPGTDLSGEQQQFLNQALGQVGNIGNMQRNALQQQYTGASNELLGDLASRGFDQSSLRTSGQLSLLGQQQSSMTDLESQLLGLRQGIQQTGQQWREQAKDRRLQYDTARSSLLNQVGGQLVRNPFL